MIHYFTRPGEYHNFDPMQNQDALCIAQDERYIVLTLADGVSSCRQAKAGATIACQALNDLLLHHASLLFSMEEGQITDLVLMQIHHCLKQQADKDRQDVTEYSSTLAGVLVDAQSHQVLLIQLGDSIILGTAGDKTQVLAAPADSRYGCPVTTTQNVEKTMTVNTLDWGELDSILLCSDGAWRYLFQQNIVKPEVNNWLLHRRYDCLEEYLSQQHCFDDNSFMAVDLTKIQEVTPYE